MNDNLINLVTKTISKTYYIHCEMCFKGDEGYIEEIYFSENDIRRGGLDISDFIENVIGLSLDDSKIIIEKWVNSKIDLEKNKYDMNKIWFRTNSFKYNSNLSVSGVTFFTGSTIMY